VTIPKTSCRPLGGKDSRGRRHCKVARRRAWAPARLGGVA